MRNITKIFTLVLSLILLFAVSCSNDDKTGVPNNPPENDTEITDGETGSGGTGSGSGSGSGEGGDGTETPPTPSEPETEEGYFPPPEGKYKSDARRWEGAGLVGSYKEPEISTKDGKTKIDGDLILHDSNIENGRYESRNAEFNVLKWKKTTKDGKITKTEAVEIEPYKIIGNRKAETPTFTEVIYDYETKTLSITCKVTIDGIEKTLSTKSEKY